MATASTHCRWRVRGLHSSSSGSSLSSLDAGARPSPRSGHIAVLEAPQPGLPFSHRMWVYGGYAREADESRVFRELYCYNTLRDSWQLVETTGERPHATCSMSAVCVNNVMLTFGGTSIPFGVHNSNTLSALDLRTMCWTTVQRRSEAAPSPRFGQSLTYDAPRRRLIMFGGTDGHIFFNDLWLFDLQSCTWTEAQPNPNNLNSIPPPCYKHQAVLFNDHLIVVGGGAPFPPRDKVLDYVHSLDLATMTWRILPCQGTPPQGRRSHACELHGSYIYMLGGISMDNGNDGDTPVLGDFWRLDLLTATWENVGAASPHLLPAPAYFQSMVCTVDGCLIVFGGVLDMRSLRRTDLVHLLRVSDCRVPSLTQLCCEKLALDQAREGDAADTSDWRVELPKHLVDVISEYQPPGGAPAEAAA